MNKKIAAYVGHKLLFHPIMLVLLFPLEIQILFHDKETTFYFPVTSPSGQQDAPKVGHYMAEIVVFGGFV